MRHLQRDDDSFLLLQAPLLYLKPVQTGYPGDSDAALVVRFHMLIPTAPQPHACVPGGSSAAVMSTQAAASGASLQEGPHAAQIGDSSHGGAGNRSCVDAHVLHAWRMPVSPHLAVEQEGEQSLVPSPFCYT
jgi:dethiobiotin synthetase/adenosylmethionine--8-amino-7-oxononanoate aminotransferase